MAWPTKRRYRRLVMAMPGFRSGRLMTEIERGSAA
jgi:hypothetical protein